MNKWGRMLTALILTAVLCLYVATGLAQGRLVLPANLKTIEAQAFEGAQNVELVVLHEGVEYIGAGAFADSGLVQIDLPMSLTAIEADAFDGCPTELVLRGYEGSYAQTYAQEQGLAFELLGGEEQEGEYTYTVFAGGATITAYSGEEENVVIPQKLGGYPVVTIGAEAFLGTWDMTSVTIPDSVTLIDEYAFYNCSHLETVKGGKGVVEVRSDAFYCKSLKAFPLFENLEMIDDYAFWCCYSLEELKLPESVQSIGEFAFADCSSLQEVCLPESVRSVGEYAFSDCESLERVTIPALVEYVGFGAFSYCPNLQRVEMLIADDVISEHLFYSCSPILVIYGEEGSPAQRYAETWGYPFAILGEEEPVKGRTEDGLYYIDRSDGVHITAYDGESEHVVVPAQLEGLPVTVIDDDVFSYRNGIKSVVLPEGLKKIGEFAFWACYDLLDLTVPASVTEIGDDAFTVTNPLFVLHTEEGSYAQTYALEEAVLFATEGTVINERGMQDDFAYVVLDGEGVITDYEGGKTQVVTPQKVSQYPVKAIGPAAFDYGKQTSITISEGVERIGNQAFYWNSATSILLPAGLKEIGSEAFLSADITQITLPEGLEKIGNSTFEECWYLDSVTLPEGLISIGDSAFRGCPLGELTLPSTLKRIGYAAFAYSVSGSIVIPASVEEIGGYAFSHCELTSVEIEGGTALKEIPEGAFYNCSGMTTLLIGKGVEEIGASSFMFCSSVKSVELPDSVIFIGDEAFSMCTRIESVIIPASVTTLGKDIFLSCGMTITVDFGSPIHAYCMENDLKYEVRVLEGWEDYELSFTDNRIVIDGYTGTKTELTIPALYGSHPVYGISDKAFEESALEEVTIQAGLRSIGTNVFEDSLKLRKVTFEPGTRRIGEGMFLNCTALETVEIPQSMRYIGDNAFSGCALLDGVDLPQGLEYLGAGVFKDCASLSAIDLPDNLPALYDETFMGCTLLYGVELPQNLQILGNSVFHSCASLTEMRIPESIRTIGEGLLAYCTSLLNVEIPPVLTEINEYMFYSCTSLTSVVIPEGVTFVDEYVFNYCDALQAIYVPESVEYMETCMANNTDATIYGSEGSYAQKYAKKHAMEFISLDVMTDRQFSCETDWDEGTYYGDITGYYGTDGKVVIPERYDGYYSIVGIAEGAFMGNDVITHLVIPEHVDYIFAEAFRGCKNLRMVEIRGELTEIGDYAFADCTSLESMNWPSFKPLDYPIGYYVPLGEGIFDGVGEQFCLTVEENDTKIIEYCEEAGVRYKLYEPPVEEEEDYYTAEDYRYTSKFDYGIGHGTLTIVGYTGNHVYVDFKVWENSLNRYDLVIGEGAFAGNDVVTGVVLPEEATEIRARAFADCTALKSITIPASVTQIAEDAFDGCSAAGFTIIAPAGSYAQTYAQENGNAFEAL